MVIKKTGPVGHVHRRGRIYSRGVFRTNSGYPAENDGPVYAMGNMPIIRVYVLIEMISIKTDNKTTVEIFNKPHWAKRRKFIVFRDHYIRKRLDDDKTTIKQVPTG